MKPINLSATALGAERIDTVNAVIRGVSILTAGIVARGHDLQVDSTSLSQMLECARAKEKIGVKIDHRSGAAAICGYLFNFRITGEKLVGDWQLLSTHPQTAQILETAEKMPSCLGLSASFLAPNHSTEPGKARCAELLSVDLVTTPAANPDGIFSAKTDRTERPMSGVEKVRRAIGAASRGAEVGAVGGLAARILARRRGITADGAATAGAAIGGIAAGAYQWRRDSLPRDLAARVSAILFQQRAALGSVLDATRKNISLPDRPEIPGEGTLARISKKPFVRRAGARLLKIGAGAGLGYYAGRRIGAKAGALTGAVAGALFESKDVRRTISLSLAHSKKVIKFT